MLAFTNHSGLVLPMDTANVDTDALLPKQYLKCIRKFGYADWLFDDLRYLDEGAVDTDMSTRRENPDFILNKPMYQGASVILARENFGCGSSREHAVWALRDYGIRAVIAPSFGDIFYNNCFKNGLLPVKLPAAQVNRLFELCNGKAENIAIDLETLQIHCGDENWSFEVDSDRRQQLLLGQDEISLSLTKADAIRAFEQRRAESQPWLV